MRAMVREAVHIVASWYGGSECRLELSRPQSAQAHLISFVHSPSRMIQCTIVIP